MQLGVAMDLTSGQWKCHIELLGRYLIGRGPENPSSSHTIPSFQKVRTWKKLDRVWAVNSDHKWPLGCKPCEESRTVQMKYGLMLWSCYTRWWPPTLIGLSNGFGFCVCVCVCVHAQLCLSLCDPMDCSLPGTSVHGIYKSRILVWVAISYSRGSSWELNQILCV